MGNQNIKTAEKPDDKWFIDAAVEISCRAEEKADSAKKWTIIATVLSIASIILHFV